MNSLSSGTGTGTGASPPPGLASAPARVSLGRVPRSVLVVDDDAFLREVLADMFGELGVACVLQAGDGAAAAAVLEGDQPWPEVILADLCMPGQDGFQLLDTLAARHYAGGLILLSGQQEPVLRAARLMAQFLQLQLLDALPKPLRLAALQAALARLN